MKFISPSLFAVLSARAGEPTGGGGGGDDEEVEFVDFSTTAVNAQPNEEEDGSSNQSPTLDMEVIFPTTVTSYSNIPFTKLGTLKRQEVTPFERFALQWDSGDEQLGHLQVNDTVVIQYDLDKNIMNKVLKDSECIGLLTDNEYIEPLTEAYKKSNESLLLEAEVTGCFGGTVYLAVSIAVPYSTPDETKDGVIKCFEEPEFAGVEFAGGGVEYIRNFEIADEEVAYNEAVQRGISAATGGVLVEDAVVNLSPLTLSPSLVAGADDTIYHPGGSRRVMMEYDSDFGPIHDTFNPLVQGADFTSPFRVIPGIGNNWEDVSRQHYEYHPGRSVKDLEVEWRTRATKGGARSIKHFNGAKSTNYKGYATTLNLLLKKVHGEDCMSDGSFDFDNHG